MYKEGCRRDTFAWQTLRDCENLKGMRQRRKRESRLERNPFVYPKYNLIKTQYFWALHIFSTLIHSKRQSNFIHSFKTKSNFMFSFKWRTWKGNKIESVNSCDRTILLDACFRLRLLRQKLSNCTRRHSEFKMLVLPTTFILTCFVIAAFS